MSVCAGTFNNKPYIERFWGVKLRAVEKLHYTSQMVEVGVRRGFLAQLDIIIIIIFIYCNWVVTRWQWLFYM